jgi:D-amino-acid oxidase
MKKIAVIGQGVIGLTVASRLMDLGFSIDIFSHVDFWKTTSTAAGAYWWPHKIYPQERISTWSKETYEEYKKAKLIGATGVTFREHLRFCLDPDDNAYARDLVDDWQEINGADFGVPCPNAYRVIIPVIDVPIFMPYLREQVLSKGARIWIRELSGTTELFPEFDLVVNCSGVWARYLVNDKSVFPIRGQVVRISKSPEINIPTRIYQKQDEFTLILPRSNDCILGGTGQENNWSLEVSENDTREIIERCSTIIPAIAECEIIGAAVGLRPGRAEVRLELEMIKANQPVVHNYGHGGGGFTVAWGCANEVAAIVRKYFA